MIVVAYKQLYEIGSYISVRPMSFCIILNKNSPWSFGELLWDSTHWISNLKTSCGSRHLKDTFLSISFNIWPFHCFVYLWPAVSQDLLLDGKREAPASWDVVPAGTSTLVVVTAAATLARRRAFCFCGMMSQLKISNRSTTQSNAGVT